MIDNDPGSLALFRFQSYNERCHLKCMQFSLLTNSDFGQSTRFDFP